MSQILALPLTLLLLASAAPPAQSPTSPSVSTGDLRTEYVSNPVGIDIAHPRLSWKIYATERSVVQSAYQIQVTSLPDGFAPGSELAWDSGRVESDQSIHVEYAGPDVRSRTRYFWRVRVWAGDREPSAWSEVAFWETGLLEPSDWQADWIRPELDSDPSQPGPAVLLRRAFDIPRRVASARIYATSHGLYELHLNGARVGDRLFTPGFTSYNRRLQYQTYEVTALLDTGRNAIGAVLADGWYRGFLGYEGRRNVYGDRLGLFLQLEIRYSDGSVEVLTSGGDWVTKEGPIVASDIYNGESYDARMELPNWANAEFDDSEWNPALVFDPGPQNLVADRAPPVRRIEERMPASVSATPGGEILIDMGQNMVGWIRLRVEGRPGQTITLRHAEVLNSEGDLYTENLRAAQQTDQYTLRGEGEEVLEPRFTFHGFRYVSIEGYARELPLEAVGIVIHSDLEVTGSFETSDASLNQLHRNILWSQKGNFLDIPTDCPQRDERLGWTGDVQLFAPTACFNMNVAGFFSKWLEDLAADQRPDGSVPSVIPDVFGGENIGAAGWADAAVLLPWTLYVSYGDERILQDQYESMRAWVEYALREAGDDRIWDPTTLQYGDHLSDPDATTATTFIATAYLAHSVGIFTEASEVLGRDLDAQRFGTLRDDILEAFQREFVTFGGALRSETQTAYILALRFGLLSESAAEVALARLVRDIRNRGNRLTTGYLGTPHVNDVLTEHGHSKLAYDLLFRQTYPSWLYPLTLGATTIWERWDGIRDGQFQDPAMNSFNHYAYGSIGKWMYETIGGIRADSTRPGYKHVLLGPLPDVRLTFARTTLETPYGRTRLNWRIESDLMDLDVEVPANSSATVRLPDARVGAVTEGGLPLEDAPGVRTVAQNGNSLLVELGSGSYRFAYRMVQELAQTGPGMDATRPRTGLNLVLLFIMILTLTGNYLLHLTRTK